MSRRKSFSFMCRLLATRLAPRTNLTRHASAEQCSYNPLMGKSSSRTKTRSLPKAPTGIHGLDEITGGGLPRGRPTLICGSAGCGKTLLAMEFLVRGAMQYDEPGVFVAFEENATELAQN